MWLMLLTASHATQQCEKSVSIATRLTSDHSKVHRGAVRPHQTPPLWHHMPLAMLVMCQPRPCRWSASDNAAWSALYSSPTRPFVLLQYQVSWRVSDPRGRSPCYGRSVLQSRAQLTSSALWKNSWHICWHTVTRIQVDPPILRGQNCPKFSTCMRVYTVITRYGDDVGNTTQENSGIFECASYHQQGHAGSKIFFLNKSL